MASKHPDSPNKLTEFAPLNSEVKQTGGFFNWLFRTKNNGERPPSQTREMPLNQEFYTDVSDDIPQEPASDANSIDSVSIGSTDTGSIGRREASPLPDSRRGSPARQVSQPEQTLRLPMVLKRLGNIMDRKSQTPQAYKDSDWKQYWMPDDNCRECYECGDRFNTFRRRHHCRICGQIFCSRCCNQEVPGKIMGFTGYLRVCMYCCKVVLSYAQNIDSSGNLVNMQEDLKQQFQPNDPETPEPTTPQSGYQELNAPFWTNTMRKKTLRRDRPTSTIFDEDSKPRLSSSPDISSPPTMTPFDVGLRSGYSTSDRIKREREVLLQDSIQLRDLWLAMQNPLDGIPMQSHRHRLRTYPNCMVGNEIIDWLVANDKANDRSQAVVLAQALLDAQWIECVTSNEFQFKDEYSLYRPGKLASVEAPIEVSATQESFSVDTDSAEPLWFKEIRSEEDDLEGPQSELEKIPSTVSADQPLGAGQSVFYVDKRQREREEAAAKYRRYKAMSISSAEGDLSNSLPKLRVSTLSALSEQTTDSEQWPPPPQETADSSRKQSESSDWLVIGNRDSLDGTSYSKQTHEQGGFPGIKERSPSVDPVDIYPNPLYQRNLSVSGGLEDLSLAVSHTSRVSSSEVSPQHFKSPDTSNIILLSEDFSGALAASDSEKVVVKMESPGGWQECDELREENGERLAFERLNKAQREHLTSLTKQMLSQEGLSFKWTETILGVVNRIAQIVRPDVKNDNDEMDIRQYVQIKKIPGGNQASTSIVNGVVCTKNVAHKKMRHNILNPKILLLRAPIEYQRVENKFSSLEPQILQEHEFLKNCVGRIMSLEPDILLVEKSVSRLAQDFLLDCGVTLIINVKPSVMERVARFTTADIVTSIDGLVSPNALGFCQNFKIQAFSLNDGKVKHLMYFDGCAHHVGCTVTLRGGSKAELKRVKNVMQFMVYAAYHARLELSFLMDEFAMPPPAPSESTLDIIGSEATTPTEDRGILRAREKPKGRFNRDTEDDVEIFKSTSREQSAERKKPASREHSKDRLRNASGEGSMSGEGEERGRKRRPMSSSTAITDQSDPLQNYQISKDETIFYGKEQLKEVHKNSSLKFKKALDDVILTVSPYIRYDVPYLESDVGSKCTLREFFGPVLYWSSHIHSDPEKRGKGKFQDEENGYIFERSIVKKLPPHAFVTKKLTAPVTDPQTQALMADFRARGGTIQLIAPRECALEAKERQEKETQSSAAAWERRLQVDCLDPFRHQRLVTLFSSFSYESKNAPYACVNPWVVSMDFYGRNDITLGAFLQRYCFRDTYKCPSETCDTPMVDHVRRFVHDNGCVQVILKRLDTPMPGYPNNILMWGWCRRCKQTTPVVPMSLDTWSMSFTKYLELRFHGNQYGRRASAEPCSHTLHQDHYQYFGFKNIVTSFKFSSITLKELCLPPIVIELVAPEISAESIERETKNVLTDGPKVYSAILEHLYRLKSCAQAETQVATLGDYIRHLQVEKDECLKSMEQLETSLKGLGIWEQIDDDGPDVMTTSVERLNTVFNIQDMIVLVKHKIAEAVQSWNAKIQDMETQQKKYEKEKSRQVSGGSSTTSKFSRDSSESVLENRWIREHMDELEVEPTFVAAGSTISSLAASHVSDDCIGSNSSTPVGSQLSLNPSHFGGTPQCGAGASWGEEGTGSQETAPPVTVVESVSSTSSKGSSFSEKVPGKAGSVDDLDSVSRTPVVDDVKSHGRSKSLGEPKKASKLASLQKEEKDKTSVKQIFSSFLSPAEVTTIQNPFPADEHFLLAPSEKLPIVIYDQEPSSIIAYTLSSDEYEAHLAELRVYLKESVGGHSPQPGRKGTDASLHDPDPPETLDPRAGALSFFRGGRDRSPNTRDGGFHVEAVRYTPRTDRDSVEEAEEADLMYGGVSNPDTNKNNNTSSKQQQQQTNYNIELQFSDNTAKFYCRVYYAEQFRKLRKLIFPDGEERYIRSLSRCFTWLARGGKSGSAFCKTQDDRFIIKQMSRYEVQSFVEFAPEYFQYITKAYQEKKPTVLAKIVGVYKIGYRNSQTNATLKQDVLVMENLFYNRKISQIFDLKGSVRNRLVTTSGKNIEDLVLLDENLLKLSQDQPLYIRPHSKTVLSLAINNDTQFLSGILVMDYSLLVGLDDTNKELVIGIIDYIRTFTWDKKLETIAKNILGGQGKLPTVVSPELYRSRFIEAMDQYFLPVPDRWSGLGRNIDC